MTPPLVRPVRVDPAGRAGPTKAEAAGPRWRRSSHGYYLPVEVSDGSPEQRILEQSVRLPPGGVVTGWAACRLHGVGYFDGLAPDGITRLPVPLALGRGRNLRPDSAVTLHRDRLEPEERTVVHGIPCAALTRSVLDAMRQAPLREAVVVMDMVAEAGLLSVERMRAYTATVDGRGVRHVRDALDLADEQSRSPWESRLRLLLRLDGGIPMRANVPVWTEAGRLLGYADLLEPTTGLVVEYDGADHRSARRQSRDERRADAMRDHGLEVCRVTVADLGDPPSLLRRVAAARDRARTPRRWTLRPPEDWVPDLPLEVELVRAELLSSPNQPWA